MGVGWTLDLLFVYAVDDCRWDKVCAASGSNTEQDNSARVPTADGRSHYDPVSHSGAWRWPMSLEWDDHRWQTCASRQRHLHQRTGLISDASVLPSFTPNISSNGFLFGSILPALTIRVWDRVKSWGQGLGLGLALGL